VQGNDWRLGKGKPPLNKYTPQEGYVAYKALWQQWLNENPDKFAFLKNKVNVENFKLTDKFATTKINQALVLEELVKESAVVNKVTLTGKSSYVTKDQLKANKANKFIGRGSETSSTNQYAKDFKDSANTGTYSSSDTVFISAEGARKDRIAPDFNEIKKAIKAGATFITDNKEDRLRDYNIGEREVVAYLQQNRYTEVEPGVWRVKDVVTRTKPFVLLDEELFELYANTFDAEAKEILNNESHPEYHNYYKYLVQSAKEHQMHINSTGRVRVGKVLTNSIGSIFKNVIKATMTSEYTSINKFKQGYFWNKVIESEKIFGSDNEEFSLYGNSVNFNNILLNLLYNSSSLKEYRDILKEKVLNKNLVRFYSFDIKRKANEITKSDYESNYLFFKYLIEKKPNLFKGEKLEEILLPLFKKKFDDKEFKFFENDIKKIIKDIKEHADDYNRGLVELEQLLYQYKNIESENTTVVNVIDWLKSTKYLVNDTLVSTYIKTLEEKGNSLKDKLNKNFVKEIATKYINNEQDITKFFSGVLTKEDLMLSYLKQQILDRGAQNKMSALIQMPIEIPKHKGQEIKPVVMFKRILDKARAETAMYTENKMIMGKGDVSRALNIDKNIINNLGLLEKALSKGEINRAWFKNNPNKKVYLKEVYTDVKIAKYDLQKSIEESIRSNIFTMNTPDSNVIEFINNIKKLNEGLVDEYNLNLKYETLKESLEYFRLNNIGFYKLKDFVVDILSKKQTIVDAYSGKEKLIFEKENIINNINNLLTMSFTMKSGSYRKNFTEKYSRSYKDIYNFFSGILKAEEGYYLSTGDGTRIAVRSETHYDKDEIDEMIPDTQVNMVEDLEGSKNYEVNIQSDEDAYVVNRTVERLKESLKRNSMGNIRATYKEILNNIARQINIDLLTHKENVKTKTDTKNKIRKGGVKSYVQNIVRQESIKRQLDGSNVSKNLTRLGELRNIAKKNEEKIKKLEKELSVLNKEKQERKDRVAVFSNYEVLTNKTEDPITLLKKEIDVYKKQNEELVSLMLQQSVRNNIGNLVLLIKKDGSGMGGSGVGDSTIKKPKVLDEDSLNQFKENSLLTANRSLTQLTKLVGDVSPENTRIALESIFKFIKSNDKEFRLVEVVPPELNEGRYKFIKDRIRKYDPKIDDAVVKNISNKDYKRLRFNTTEDIIAHKGKVVFNNRIYDSIQNPEILLAANEILTPTLKEILIKDVKDLEIVYEQNKKGSLIGIVDLNTWMKSMSENYMPYTMSNPLDNFFFKLQIFEKNLSKFNIPFLFRNVTDSVNQLFTNSIILPKTVEESTYLNATLNSIDLYNMYTKYNDELTITMINANLQYEDILKQIKLKVPNPKGIDNKINEIKSLIKSYIIIGESLKEPTQNIVERIKDAKQIFSRLDMANNKNVDKYLSVLKNAVMFVFDTRFAEYIEMFDNRIVNGVWVAGMRGNSKDINGKVIEDHDSIDKVNKDFEKRKPLLNLLSSFMQTEALNDYLRKNRFELLPKFFESYKAKDPLTKLSYEDYKKRIEKIKGGWFRFINPVKGYDNINTIIENGARITNFLYNIMLYNKTFDEATNDSLTHWFNYGLRTPLEMRLSADIPFLSFPLRSIGNWMDRLLSPSYWRFMSDFIDGWYAQYRDEDEEYDDFMKYQIRQGWIPLSREFGIRVGNGAFDVMNLLYNTTDEIEKRTAPILKGVQSLVKGEGFQTFIAALAVTGFSGNVTNLITGVSDTVLGTNLRAKVARFDPAFSRSFSGKAPDLFNTVSGLGYRMYNYEKFTPRRYRYESNGRYAKYENIYKDWFTKYGTMRKPKVNPYSLVKDIQWRQYVRYRRSRNVVG